MNEQQIEIVEVDDTSSNISTFVTPLPIGSYKLRPGQLKAAQMIVENEMTIKRKGAKRKTYKQLSSELGIDEDTLIKWRGLDEFKRYVKDATQSLIEESMAMAAARLYQLADGSISGNPSVKAIEMILTMGGLLTKTQAHEITVKNALNLTEVSDEELAQIVAEYDEIPDEEPEVDEDKTEE